MNRLREQKRILKTKELAMAKTYRAVQVSKPGRLEVVERELTAPPPGKVRIRVEACGVCHSDTLTVEGLAADVRYPRVPGHEVVGKIDALGEGVSAWKLGQRVGVGFLAGYCGRCTPCRQGDFVNCQNQPVTGVADDGGYAEVMFADEHALAVVPAELAPADAAPLVCAGVTTYNALRNSPARPGDLVAVQGIGGLGHLAVQFASRMGFRVAAIARGEEKRELARKLGAHHYIDSQAGDPAAALQELGGASVILATVTSGKAMSLLLGGLRARGRMIVVGVGPDPIEVSTVQLVFGTRAIEGALTGSPLDGEDTLAFSALEGIRPTIETVPLESAAEAYGKMMRNEARFRMVLVTGQ
jgi:D-arabinose 1-dehydrogenase-like Zn-dependent alcohol dehydrogenase